MWPERNGLFWFASKGYPVDKDEGGPSTGCRNSHPSPCVNSILRGRKERLAKQEVGKQSLRVQNEKQGVKDELGRNLEEDESQARRPGWCRGALGGRGTPSSEVFPLDGAAPAGLDPRVITSGVGGWGFWGWFGFFLEEGVLFCSVDVVPGVEIPGWCRSLCSEWQICSPSSPGDTYPLYQPLCYCLIYIKKVSEDFIPFPLSPPLSPRTSGRVSSFVVPYISLDWGYLHAYKIKYYSTPLIQGQITGKKAQPEC